MTQKEAIRIAKEFGFQKKTVLPEESGNTETFHYFNLELEEKQIEFMLHNDDAYGDWGMTIELGEYLYYDYESCINILSAVINGQ